MDQSPKVRQSAKITSANGDQLILLQVEVPIPNPNPRMKAYDFHSLVWQSRSLDDKKVITRSDFRSGSARSRWISDIHTFDPDQGTAIIKVAEEGEPADGKVRIQYSWREWDLKQNCEKRLIHLCELPSDPMPENNGS